MATLPTSQSFVITGRHSGYTRDSIEAAIKRVGGTIQQLVGPSTDWFFDFAEDGKGRKYASWKKASDNGEKVVRLDSDAFELLLNNPVAFASRYVARNDAMPAKPQPRARPEKLDPAAMIPQRKSMFSMNI